ncbi:MAG: hypothetical protein M1831_004966 [Alyxoria varia]|nr:MAG: hypothetical protein M1831_004966 [Alyxoria varia]
MSEAYTSSLVNPLATPAQLETSSSQLDGVPADLENSIRFAACRLIQAAGALLHLPQDIVAHAIITYTRFWIGPDGGSLRIYSGQDIAAACVYLVTKLSAHPQSPRNIINVFGYLTAPSSTFSNPRETMKSLKPEAYYVSEETYHAQRGNMIKHEAIVLRILGFQTHMALPYTLCINYLQTMDTFRHESGSDLARRAFAYLNTLLLSPQLVYLTHHPPALATAAIYLAAKEVGFKLPEEEWWEVFDTDREDLGFLLVAMTSMSAFANEEKKVWGNSEVPLSVEQVNAELDKRAILES